MGLSPYVPERLRYSRVEYARGPLRRSLSEASRTRNSVGRPAASWDIKIVERRHDAKILIGRLRRDLADVNIVCYPKKGIFEDS